MSAGLVPVDALQMIPRWLEPDEKLVYYSDYIDFIQCNEWGKAKLQHVARIGGNLAAALTDRRFFTLLKASTFGSDTRLEHEVVYNPDYAEYRVKNRLNYYMVKLSEGEKASEVASSPKWQDWKASHINLMVKSQAVDHHAMFGTGDRTVGLSTVYLPLRHQKHHETVWYTLYELFFQKPVYFSGTGGWTKVESVPDVLAGFLQNAGAGVTQDRLNQLWEMAYAI